MSGTCKVCTGVLQEWDIEYQGLNDDMSTFDFGRVDEIEAREDCPLCWLVLSLVPYSLRNVAAGSECGPTPRVAGQIANLYSAAGSHEPHNLNIYLNGKVANKGLSMKGIPLGKLTTKQPWVTDEVELPLSYIGSKISVCQADHKADAFFNFRLRSPVRINLIDVLQNNVCERDIDERYFALSYVWGGITGLQARKSNHEDLRKVGALGNANAKVSRVVEDAIQVTRILGERYLWVDSLCIEQDNAEHKAEQIALMDQIYLNSALTIVALSGRSGREPLPGVRTETSLNPKANVLVNGRKLFVRPPSLYEIFESCTYETRGWTFQERCLSPRLLLFTDHAWYYHCHGELISNGMWWQAKQSGGYRDLFEALNLIRSPAEDFTISLAPTPETIEFFRYQAIVLVYSARKLSSYGDAQHAVSALLTAISTKMDSGFAYGLPERFLGFSLLWIPSGHYPAGSGVQKERIRDKDGNPIFPSWTWLAYIGQSQYSPGPLSLCFPTRDNVDYWLDGDISIGFIDEISSYILATDTEDGPERKLATTRHPIDPVQLSERTPSTMDNTSWTHLKFTATTADASQFSLSPASYDQPWCLGRFQNVGFTNWHPLRILDHKSRHCGCFFEFTEEGFDLNLDLTNCKFIALSSSNPPCVASGRCCDSETSVGSELDVRQKTVIQDYEGSGHSSDGGLDDWHNTADHLDDWASTSVGSEDNSDSQPECGIEPFMFDKSCFRPFEWCLVYVMLVYWSNNRAERIGVGIIHRNAWLALSSREEKVNLY